MKRDNCDKFIDILSTEDEDRRTDYREFIKEHIKVCSECSDLYKRFTEFEATAKINLTVETEANFTERVINKLKPHLSIKKVLTRDEGFLSYIFSSATRVLATVSTIVAGIISIVLLLIYKPIPTITVDMSFINRYLGYIFNYTNDFASLLTTNSLVLYPIVGATIMIGSLFFTWKNEIIRGLYRVL